MARLWAASSGSALIACEQTGREAFLMEIDPLCCDVIVQRWEQFTGKKGRADRGCRSRGDDDVNHLASQPPARTGRESIKERSGCYLWNPPLIAFSIKPGSMQRFSTVWAITALHTLPVQLRSIPKTKPSTKVASIPQGPHRTCAMAKATELNATCDLGPPPASAMTRKTNPRNRNSSQNPALTEVGIDQNLAASSLNISPRVSTPVAQYKATRQMPTIKPARISRTGEGLCSRYILAKLVRLRQMNHQSNTLSHSAGAAANWTPRRMTCIGGRP